GEEETLFVPVPIQADNDAFGGWTSSPGSVGSVLVNDRFDGDFSPPIEEVDLFVLSPATSIGGAPVPELDPATGEVTIPIGTPNGTYTIVYQICEKDAILPNCDDATVTVYVSMAESCVGDETVYRLDPDATVAENSAFDVNSGIIQVVFSLVSGPEIASLGTTFTLPI